MHRVPADGCKIHIFASRASGLQRFAAVFRRPQGGAAIRNLLLLFWLVLGSWKSIATRH